MRIFNRILTKLGLKKKGYYFEPFVYINPDGSVCKDGMTTRVKWLEKFYIEEYSEEMATIKARGVLIQKYGTDSLYIFLF